MSIPTNGITPEVIRGVMPPYHLSPDLLARHLRRPPGAPARHHPRLAPGPPHPPGPRKSPPQTGQCRAGPHRRRDPHHPRAGRHLRRSAPTRPAISRPDVPPRPHRRRPACAPPIGCAARWPATSKSRSPSSAPSTRTRSISPPRRDVAAATPANPPTRPPPHPHPSRRPTPPRPRPRPIQPRRSPTRSRRHHRSSRRSPPSRPIPRHHPQTPRHLRRTAPPAPTRMFEPLDQGPGYTREVLRRRTPADPLPEPAE